MISKDKMAAELEHMATIVRKMPEDAEFICATFSGSFGVPELHMNHKSIGKLIDAGAPYTTEYWEGHELTEVKTDVDGIRVYALFTDDQYEEFREMQKTPDAATPEVDEEEFIERMNDLQELFSQDIVTPNEEDVKEGDAR